MEINNSLELHQRYSLAGVEHEVVYIDHEKVVFANVHYQRRLVIQLDEVLSKIHKGIYKFLQAAPASAYKAALYLALSEKQKTKLSRKIDYINATSKEFSGRFPKSATIAFLADYSTQINDSKPPSYSTLKGWITAYRESNENPLSLVPRDWNRKPSGKSLDIEVKKILDYYINNRHLTPERGTAQSVYNSVCAHIKLDNENKPDAEHLKPPARATVNRHIAKLNGYLKDHSRLGPDEAKKRHKYSRKIRSILRLLERVEMDSHLIDLIIIDDHGRKIPRRAWLCIAIEVCTGAIQAWEISLTPPCAEKTLRVLKQCFSSSNPLGGKAETYYFDNGSEFQNSPVINLLNLYNSKITFVPPRSPDHKPSIERFFGTLNTQLIHHMPGTTRSNPVDQTGYDSEKRARITLSKLREYFEEWLTTVYHVMTHGGRQLSPLQAWTQMMNEGFPPARYSDDELNLVCCVFELRKISGGRVVVDYLSWYGPGLTTLAEKIGRGKDARVYYDPTDLGTVYVADPDNPTHMVMAHATDPDYQNGLTMYEHKIVQKEIAATRCKFSADSAMIALANIQARIADECGRPLKNPQKVRKTKQFPKLTSAKLLTLKFAKKI